MTAPADRPAVALTEERIAHLRRWDELHGPDFLKLCGYGHNAAAIITNWDSIRDGLHEALNEVERQRRVLADLARFDAEVFRLVGHEADLPREES